MCRTFWQLDTYVAGQPAILINRGIGLQIVNHIDTIFPINEVDGEKGTSNIAF